MNKHSIITIIAIVIIIIPFAYSGLSIVGAQQLEYRWDNPGEFTFFTTSRAICSPSRYTHTRTWDLLGC